MPGRCLAEQIHPHPLAPAGPPLTYPHGADVPQVGYGFNPARPYNNNTNMLLITWVISNALSYADSADTDQS